MFQNFVFFCNQKGIVVQQRFVAISNKQSWRKL